MLSALSAQHPSDLLHHFCMASEGLLKYDIVAVPNVHQGLWPPAATLGFCRVTLDWEVVQVVGREKVGACTPEVTD
jgi:hypothetical protein